MITSFSHLRKLVESLHRHPDNNLVDFFTNEQCAAFAYALWLSHNKQGVFVLLSDSNGEGWNGMPEFTHVAFRDGEGYMYDVLGAQMPDEIIDRFGRDTLWIGTYLPQDFWNNYVGDDKPLRADQESIDMALRIIDQYPDIYGIKS